MNSIKKLIISFLLPTLCLIGGCQKNSKIHFTNQDDISMDPTETIQTIVNGENMSENDPFALSIVGVVNLEKGSLCTGTLINRQHVLTAAHCLSKNVYSLRIFTGIKKGVNNNILDATSMKTPPQWETRSTEAFDRGDIAIIKISGELPKKFRPVLLGPSNTLVEGNESLIAGYGRADGFKKTGAGTLRKTKVLIANAHYGETEVQFDQTQGTGACHGDSGGPAYITNPQGFYYQWGVTSRENQDPDKDCTHYSIYTKIDAYLPWIDENIKD